MIAFIAILVVTGLISFWAMSSLKSTYAKYLQVETRSGLTGAQVAAAILQRAGIGDVDIVQGQSILGEMGVIQPGEEARGVEKVLGAAAMTYVAAFLTSLAWTLYYLLPLLLRRN